MKNVKLLLGTLALIVATGTFSYSMEETKTFNEALIGPPGEPIRGSVIKQKSRWKINSCKSRNRRNKRY